MEKLKKALKERTEADEGKGLKLSERLQKAKYIKRTGGPGKYKYIYKVTPVLDTGKKPRGKFGQKELSAGTAAAYKQRQIKILSADKGFPKQYAGALKHLTGPQISYIKLEIEKGWKIPVVKGSDTAIANAFRYEMGTTDKQFTAAVKRSTGASERQAKKEEDEEERGDIEVGIHPKEPKREGKETLDWYFSKKAKRIKEMKEELQDLGWDEDELGEMRDSEIQDLYKEQMAEYKRKKDRGK